MCSGAGCSAYGSPPMVLLPAVGRSSPTTIRIVVVFSAPLGSKNPVTSPGSTRNVTWSTAVLRPNALVRSLTSIMSPSLETIGP